MTPLLECKRICECLPVIEITKMAQAWLASAGQPALWRPVVGWLASSLASKPGRERAYRIWDVIHLQTITHR